MKQSLGQKSSPEIYWCKVERSRQSEALPLIGELERAISFDLEVEVVATDARVRTVILSDTSDGAVE